MTLETTIDSIMNSVAPGAIPKALECILNISYQNNICSKELYSALYTKSIDHISSTVTPIQSLVDPTISYICSSENRITNILNYLQSSISPDMKNSIIMELMDAFKVKGERIPASIDGIFIVFGQTLDNTVNSSALTLWLKESIIVRVCPYTLTVVDSVHLHSLPLLFREFKQYLKQLIKANISQDSPDYIDCYIKIKATMQGVFDSQSNIEAIDIIPNMINDSKKIQFYLRHSILNADHKETLNSSSVNTYFEISIRHSDIPLQNGCLNAVVHSTDDGIVHFEDHQKIKMNLSNAHWTTEAGEVSEKGIKRLLKCIVSAERDWFYQINESIDSATYEQQFKELRRKLPINKQLFDFDNAYNSATAFVNSAKQMSFDESED